MKSSRYNVWLLSKNKKVLCYNCLSSGFAQIDSNANAVIKRIDQGNDLSNFTKEENLLINELVKGKIIEKDDAFLEEHRHRYLLANYNSSSLPITIIPTLGCNLKCSYCFQDHKRISMSEEVLALIKDHINNTIITKRFSNLFLNWFGGEPLLQFDIMVELMNYVSKKCKINKVQFSSDMVSNCVLLDEKKAKKLASLGLTNIQATIDGSRKCHNKKRKFSNGNSTFDLILENILNASKYINITVRINVDKNSTEDLDELFNDIKPLNNKNNIIIYPGRIRSEITNVCASIKDKCLNIKEFAEVSYLFYKKAIENGFDMSWYPSYSIGGCGATNINSMIIQPDGSLCRCWSQVGIEGESYANLKNINETFDPKNYYKWVLYNPYNYPKCVRCKYFHLCKAGCPAERIPQTTEVMKPTNTVKTNCIPERFNIKKMLLLYYEHFQNQQVEQGQKSE